MDVNFLSDDRKRREEQERRRLAQKKIVRPMTTPYEMSDPGGAEHRVSVASGVNKELSETGDGVTRLRQTATIHETGVLPREKKPSLFRRFIHMFKRSSPRNKIVTPSIVEVDAKEPQAKREPVVPPSQTVSMIQKETLPEGVNDRVKSATPAPTKPELPKRPHARWPLPLASIEVATFFAVIVVVFVSGLATGLVFLTLEPDPVAPPAIVIPPDEHELAVLRDEIRLAHVALIQESLDEYWRRNDAHYPIGDNLILGAIEATCLGSSGWTTHDRCAIPQSPSENHIYLSLVPSDPSGGVYRYTSLEGGRAYQLTFVLENGSGTYGAGEQRVTGGAVSNVPSQQP